MKSHCLSFSCLISLTLGVSMVIVIVSTSAISNREPEPQNANLNYFVQQALIKFRNDAIELRVDPLEIIGGPINVEFSNALYQVSGTLWDIDQVGLSTLYDYYIDTSLTGKITTFTMMSNHKLTGHYDLSGSFFSSIPLNATGIWTIIPGRHWVDMYAGFTLVDGYAFVNNETIDTSYFIDENEFRVDFPELAQQLGAFAGDVLPPIAMDIIYRVRAEAGSKIATLVYGYMNQLFAEAPFVDIITRPIPTEPPTEPPRTTTTTPWPTTTTLSPCKPQKTQHAVPGSCILSDMNGEVKILSNGPVGGSGDDDDEMDTYELTLRYQVPKQNK